MKGFDFGIAAFRNLSVGAKVLGVVGTCLVLLVAVAATAVYQLNRVGIELTGIAERDVPLTQIVTNITVHQLEQAVLFERAVRLSEEMRVDASVEPALQETTHEFEAVAKQVDAEIVEGETLAQHSVETAETEAARTEFAQVLEILKTIELEHQQYTNHAKELLAAMAAGTLHDTHARIEALEHEQAEVDRKLEELLSEIGEFTESAAVTAEQHEQTALQLIVALGIAALVLGMGLSWALTRFGIARPLAEVVAALDKLTKGETDVAIVPRANDEIGKVASALGIFRDNLVEVERMRAEEEERKRRDQEAEVKRQAEEEERKQQAEREKREVMLKLADSFESRVGGVVQNVSSAATEMESTAQTMSATAEQTSQQSTTVAAAAEQATSNVQTVASAAEELSSSISEISRQVATSNDVAKRGADQAKHTNATVQGLAEAAEKIGEVVKLIQDIAEQTNLLALNATIEAARAGEAGKGFAVVASEVKSLATQTARATDEIGQQISAMQSATTGAVGAIEGITEIIAEVSETAAAIASAVEEQGAATQEIARNVQQAAAGTQEVSSNIAGVSEGARETGNAVNNMLTAAGELSREAETLRKEVDTFLSEVRVA